MDHKFHISVTYFVAKRRWVSWTELLTLTCSTKKRKKTWLLGNHLQFLKLSFVDNLRKKSFAFWEYADSHSNCIPMLLWRHRRVTPLFWGETNRFPSW